jgi:hypothetical protein
MDNDGDNDIVKMSTLYANPPFDVGQYILFNNGAGVFDEIPFQGIFTDLPYMFTVAHLNDDGMYDLYLQGSGQDDLAIAVSVHPDSNIVYSQNPLSNSPRTTGFGGNLKTADIDGDGDLDVGVCPIDSREGNCGFSSTFALLRNAGDGVFEDPWPAEADQNFHLDPHDFVFVDVNNDGCLDMFMGLCVGAPSFATGEGWGTDMMSGRLEGCRASSVDTMSTVTFIS